MYVEKPSVVALKSGVALIGYPTYEWLSPTVFTDSGPAGQAALSRSANSAGAMLLDNAKALPIPKPPGRIQLRDPQAVSDATGHAETYWGDGGDSVSFGTSATEIWTAMFDGASWSRPSRVLALKYIAWNNTAPVILHTRDGTWIGVPAYGTVDGHYHSGIITVRRAATGTITSWIETPLPAASVALIENESGNPVVAFVGALPDSVGVPINGVYIVRSMDAGRSWQKPELLYAHTPTSQSAFPVLVRPSKGPIHLLWAERSLASESVPLVRHMISTDNGGTWTAALNPPVDDRVDALTATVGTGQGFFLLTRSLRAHSVALTRWTGSRWLGTDLPADRALSIPTMGVVANNELYVTWGTDRGSIQGFPTVPAPVLRLAQLCIPPAPR
jgi:hypothetical protein